MPLKVYDESIAVLKQPVGKAEVGRTDKLDAIRRLDAIARRVETDLAPGVDFEAYLAKERREAPQYDGRTVFDKRKRESRGQRRAPGDPHQPYLFDPDAPG